MPEKKQGYMAELDQWTEETILSPFASAVTACYSADNDSASAEAEKRYEDVVTQVKQVIREKVLQSYRNGQAAAPSKRFYGKPKQK